MKPFTSEVTGTERTYKSEEEAMGQFDVTGTPLTTATTDNKEMLYVQICTCNTICPVHDTPTLGKDSPNLKFFVENVKKAFADDPNLPPAGVHYHIYELLSYLEPFI